MNTRYALASLVLFSMTTVACGGDPSAEYCGKIRQCAEKSGASFSETECTNELDVALESAETSGCGSEYDEYLSCAASLDYECSEDWSAKIASECGAALKAASKCDGTVFGSPCERAAERIAAKTEECSGQASSSDDDDDGEEVACTDERAAEAEKVADCFEAASCAALSGEDAEGALQLSECFSR